MVKDELQEGDGLLLGNSNSTTHSNCSSARPAAAHSERAKSKAVRVFVTQELSQFLCA